MQQRRSALEAAMNYSESYEINPNNHLQRTGSSRQYASSLQRSNEKVTYIPPMNVTTPSIPRPASIVSTEIEHSPNRKFSQRVYSSTSLSSTGYDSNSSPSIKSNRNSIATSNSNDFIGHSLSSSSSSSSSSAASSDELRRKAKPWVSQSMKQMSIVVTLVSSDLPRIESDLFHFSVLA